MFTQWSKDEPNKALQRRAPRTKNACVTCRQRKVRCDERKPKCGHCHRLGRNCQWKDQAHIVTRINVTSPDNEDDSVSRSEHDSMITQQNSITAPQDNSNLDLNQAFDYASFLWTNAEDINWQPEQQIISQEYQQDGLRQNGTENRFYEDLALWPSPAASLSEDDLSSYFTRSTAPPILAHIETNLKWSVMRKALASMSISSPMVRNAILAFSSLQLEESGRQRIYHGQYYDRSREELVHLLTKKYARGALPIGELAHVLAVFFLLSYIDLVTNRSDYAHVNLREAYDLVKSTDLSSLDHTNKRLIHWLRLLDARAVSAGGEGLFLAEDEDNPIIALDLTSPHETEDIEDGADDVHEALHDALSGPAFAFFQKLQSFMGRISLIDQWHRSRGTVEDETEVMNIAARINRDLCRLYHQRPALMDFAVEGKIQEPYVSRMLATSLTRSLRTYLANYHASFIHLHRVAYRHLPQTQSVTKAMATIQQMARLMAGCHDTAEESLPVNMLWPLLMWGCEEDSVEERAWIVSSIRKMGDIATNAGITADVLEEVQRRQDAGKQRVDVRSVMQDIFDSSWAIV